VRALIDQLGALPPRHDPFPRMTPAHPQEQLGAVFVFAPRDEHELHWAKALLSVSHAWASGALCASPAEASAFVHPSVQST
jgi:hypothetical protein